MPVEQRQMKFSLDDVKSVLAEAAGYPVDSTEVEVEWTTAPDSEKVVVAAITLKCSEVREKAVAVVRPPTSSPRETQEDAEAAAAAGLETESVSGFCGSCKMPGTIVDVPPIAGKDTPVWCPHCSAKTTLGQYAAGLKKGMMGPPPKQKRMSRQEEMEQAAIEAQMDGLGL